VSFTTYKGYEVVACDVCRQIAAIGYGAWRLMRHTTDGQPRHLCPGCRKAAQWCEAHQTYHLPTELHRRPCVSCGGLFTAQVDLGRQHCPACARSLTPEGQHPLYERSHAHHAVAGLTHLIEQWSSSRRR
jgi:hypothetical protein